MTDYRREIEDAAAHFALNPDLVEAVVLTESSGHADAFRYEPAFYERYIKGTPEWDGWIPRRVASSYGLMQVMFTTARMLGFQDEPEVLFVPRVNLFYGCKYLTRLLTWAMGQEAKALAAYNAGQGNWQSDAGRAYAQKVLTTRDRLLRDVQV